MRAILLPVKAFDRAKGRLAPVLDGEERSALARALADVVVAANGTEDLYVACDSGEVADWAVHAGAYVLWTPGLGLSGAVISSVAHLGTLGYDLVVVAHADLPLMTSLREFGTPGTVTLAPDRVLDGTNVAAVPPSAGFRFAYGPGSFARHRAEATRVGLPLRVVYDPALAADVDVPADLRFATALTGAQVQRVGTAPTVPGA